MSMTANIIPIYGASVLSIGMLALFARQNRKSGWKRERSTFAQAMSSLYKDFGIELEEAPTPRPESSVPPVWAPVRPSETIDFSAQLLKLRGALGSAGAPVTNAPAVRELVRR